MLFFCTPSLLLQQPANEPFLLLQGSSLPASLPVLLQKSQSPLSYSDLQAMPSIAWHQSLYIPSHMLSRSLSTLVRCHSPATMPEGKPPIAVSMFYFSLPTCPNATSKHHGFFFLSIMAASHQNIHVRCYILSHFDCCSAVFLSLRAGFLTFKL